MVAGASVRAGQVRAGRVRAGRVRGGRVRVEAMGEGARAGREAVRREGGWEGVN